MSTPKLFLVVGLFLTELCICSLHAAARAVLPDSVLDLRTTAGVDAVKAQWRYSDTVITEIDHRDVGPDLKATGRANLTFDFGPDAHAAGFDDSHWEIIPAESLEQRRRHGRLSFNWYRLNVTMPETAGALKVNGATVVFEIVVDDYAEVWVNGKLGYVLGQQGGTVAAGWNAPNRVVLTRNAQPGQQFHIAVFGINGPVSKHPDTYIWVRNATLDFFAPGRLTQVMPAKLEVDLAGNVYVGGPGGLWLWSPEGRHLGTLHGPEHSHNFNWSDADRRTLYLAAQTGIYRIRLNIAGAGSVTRLKTLKK